MKLFLRALKEKDQIAIGKKRCTFLTEMQTTYPIGTGQWSNKTNKRVNIIIVKLFNSNKNKFNLSNWTRKRCIMLTTKLTSYIRTVVFNLQFEDSLWHIFIRISCRFVSTSLRIHKKYTTSDWTTLQEFLYFFLF